jgi:hypothetical protein
MSDLVRLTPRERDLKLALRDLIEALGGLDRAAHGCRVGKSSLSLYQSMDSAQFAPIDVVACLEERAGVWPVTAALASRNGLALVAERSTAEARSLFDLAGRIAKECGEAVSLLVDLGRPGGTVSPRVLDEARRELDEAIEPLRAARAALEVAA